MNQDNHKNAFVDAQIIPFQSRTLYNFHSFQDYQFWTRADMNGFFTINNVRPGDYNLFAWVPGFIGDYRFGDFVKITSGSLT